jgi:hypothetical protein
MKITNTAIVMESQHAAVRRQEVRETLRSWIGDRRPDFEGRERGQPASVARISDAARATQAAETPSSASDELGGDPVLSLLKTMIEWLTGRPIRVFSAADLNLEATVANQAGQAAPASPGAGFGVEYDYHAVVEESEQTAFAAEGVIRTADGRDISFRLDLTMARHYREETNVSLRAGNAQRKDPLVINFGGTATQLSSQRFSFDLNADGQTEDVPLLAGGSGYLALDINGNGRIDSGAELFGPASGAGFAELAKHDQDGNGWIDENDAVFEKLQVWTPAADGAGDLAGLKQRGVGALYLGHLATPFELRGEANSDLGAVKASGLYLMEDGGGGTLQEIDLTV